MSLPVKIAVADDHLDQFPEVVEALRKAGMTVQQELGAAGVVTGSVEPEDLERVEQVEGVAFVEPAASFQIAPPESDLQ